MKLTNCVVAVTGSNGFLGRNFVQYIMDRVDCKLYTDGRAFNFLNRTECKTFFENINKDVDYLFHFASHNGGIQFNRCKPFDVFANNTLMTLNLLHTLSEYPCVRKTVIPLTSCGYPDYGEDLLTEREFLSGNCHTSVACHGYAKRAIQLGCTLLHTQYKANVATFCPNTLLGPGDSLDLDKTKVGMSIIKKVVEAQRANSPSITLWGTGNPLREFIYVEDVVRFAILVGEHYNDPFQPINCTNIENLVTISGFAQLVKEESDYKGEILWDTTKADGQNCKKLSADKMRRFLDQNCPSFQFTSLQESIRRTIEWFRSTLN